MHTEPVARMGTHEHPRVQILLVDEHRICREGLRRLFEDEPGFAVVGDASGPDDALQAVEAHKPDIAFVSLAGRPLVRLMQGLQYLRAENYGVRTIVLTTTIERRHIVQAVQLGVSGLLLKETSAQLMLESVRAVVAGRCWMGREPLIEMADALVRPARDGTQFWLTPRELEIVDAVRRGDTNKTIARQLSITENTVKHHLTNIFSKVGVLTRLQLAVFAINQKLTLERASMDDVMAPAS